MNLEVNEMRNNRVRLLPMQKEMSAKGTPEICRENEEENKGADNQREQMEQ